jgi:hypothetical protein
MAAANADMSRYKRSSKGSIESPFPPSKPGDMRPGADAQDPLPPQPGADREPQREPPQEYAESSSDGAARGKRKPAFDRDGPVEAVALQSDWQFWNIFADVRTIGKGHFAKVKQVLHNESTENFAAKILDKAMADNDIEDLVRHRARACLPLRPTVSSPDSRPSTRNPPQVREFQMLRALRHCNIIRLFAAYETPRKLYLVTEVRAPPTTSPCTLRPSCCLPRARCCAYTSRAPGAPTTAHCHARRAASSQLATGGELMKRLGSDTSVYSEECASRRRVPPPLATAPCLRRPLAATHTRRSLPPPAARRPPPAWPLPTVARPPTFSRSLAVAALAVRCADTR